MHAQPRHWRLYSPATVIKSESETLFAVRGTSWVWYSHDVHCGVRCLGRYPSLTMRGRPTESNDLENENAKGLLAGGKRKFEPSHTFSIYLEDQRCGTRLNLGARFWNSKIRLARRVFALCLQPFVPWPDRHSGLVVEDFNIPGVFIHASDNHTG